MATLEDCLWKGALVHQQAPDWDSVPYRRAEVLRGSGRAQANVPVLLHWGSYSWECPWCLGEGDEASYDIYGTGATRSYPWLWGAHCYSRPQKLQIAEGYAGRSLAPPMPVRKMLVCQRNSNLPPKEVCQVGDGTRTGRGCRLTSVLVGAMMNKTPW